jgi:hypothetical protein
MSRLRNVRIADRMIPIACVVLVVIIASAANIFADNIFSNPISDANPVSGLNPYTGGQTFDPNITVSGIGHGSGVSGNAATGGTRYNMQNWTASQNADNYFTWTLTPVTGYEMSLNSLSGTWQRSGTGPNQYMLESSLDNFASSLGSGSITGNGSATMYNIDLTSTVSLQNVTTPVEFRLYAWGSTSSGGTFSINDFTFDGSVTQSSTGPTAFPGDYNGDGVVDAQDFVTYAKGGTLQNETASLGAVDSADFDVWRQNFGNSQTVGGGTALRAGGVEVPEPTSIVLAIVAVALFGAGTRVWR